MAHHNLMVDIETLDDKNTSAIISIGAVVFDPESAHVEERQFHVNIDFEDALRYGTYSESTIEFWERQPPEATATLFDPEPIGLEDALKAFDKYIASWKPKPKWIWGCSPSFDVANLRHAYSKFDRKFPYIFWKEMDVRTLKNLIPKEQKPVMEGIAHTALDDCIFQCKFVQLFHGVEFDG